MRIETVIEDLDAFRGDFRQNRLLTGHLHLLKLRMRLSTFHGLERWLGMIENERRT